MEVCIVTTMCPKCETCFNGTQEDIGDKCPVCGYDGKEDLDE